MRCLTNALTALGRVEKVCWSTDTLRRPAGCCAKSAPDKARTGAMRNALRGYATPYGADSRAKAGKVVCETAR